MLLGELKAHIPYLIYISMSQEVRACHNSPEKCRCILSPLRLDSETGAFQYITRLSQEVSAIAVMMVVFKAQKNESHQV